MPTYFLKFDSKEQAEAAFIANGIPLKNDGTLPTNTTVDGQIMAIDTVFGTGKIYLEDGTEADGYHVNVSQAYGWMTPYLLDPQPEFPKCVFYE